MACPASSCIDERNSGLRHGEIRTNQTYGKKDANVAVVAASAVFGLDTAMPLLT